MTDRQDRIKLSWRTRDGVSCNKQSGRTNPLCPEDFSGIIKLKIIPELNKEKWTGDLKTKFIEIILHFPSYYLSEVFVSDKHQPSI